MLAPLAQYLTLTVKVQAIGMYRFIVHRPGIGREFWLRGPLPLPCHRLSLFKLELSLGAVGNDH